MWKATAEAASEGLGSGGGGKFSFMEVDVVAERDPYCFP